MSTGVAGHDDGGGAAADKLAERVFRAIFLVVFLSSLAISGYHRKRAREASGAIPRRAEGRFVLLLRVIGGLTLFGSFLAYVVSPRRLAWATLKAPKWLRWAVAAVAIACLPLLEWMFVSIGSNISETVLTKHSHQLVTQGPYKWIRHPLYAFASLEFLSLAVLAGNWFMLAVAAALLFVFRFVVIPSEERNLIGTFGHRYVEYTLRTGVMLPRVRH